MGTAYVAWLSAVAPGAAFCPSSQKMQQKTSLFLIPVCFAYAKQAVLVTWIPFYHLRETAHLLDLGFKQGVLVCLSQLAQLSSKASTLIWSRNIACYCHHLAGFFSLLCITLELSLENCWFFWVTDLDEKYAFEYKRSKSNPPPDLPKFLRLFRRTHRYPWGYSCLLPKIS